MLTTKHDKLHEAKTGQVVERDHIFSGIQRWYAKQMDGFLGVEYKETKSGQVAGRGKPNVAAPFPGIAPGTKTGSSQ